jgi:hypothetical protein
MDACRQYVKKLGSEDPDYKLLCELNKREFKPSSGKILMSKIGPEERYLDYELVDFCLLTSSSTGLFFYASVAAIGYFQMEWMLYTKMSNKAIFCTVSASKVKRDWDIALLYAIEKMLQGSLTSTQNLVTFLWRAKRTFKELKSTNVLLDNLLTCVVEYMEEETGDFSFQLPKEGCLGFRQDEINKFEENRSVELHSILGLDLQVLQS